MPVDFAPTSGTDRNDAENIVKFDSAVASRDPKALVQVAQNSFGTPMAETALQTAQLIDNRQKEFANTLAPLEAKGGASTPEGRQEVVKIWKNTAENPQWGTALVKYLLGDKEGAAKQITGGNVEEKIVFDVNGNQLQKRVNSLGETLGVIDLKTGKPVLPEEYADRKVGFGTFAETMGGKMAAIDADKRANALAENQKTNNAWSARMPVLGQQFAEIHDNLMELQSKKGDIPADIFARLMRFNTQAQGSSASQSEANSTLDQLSKNSGFRSGEQISKGLSSQLGLEGVWTFNGKGGITNDKGETKSLGELQQKNSSANKSNEQTQNFNSLKTDILKSEQLRGMDPTLQAKLLRTLELSQNIAKETGDLTSKVGAPSFLSLPAAFNIENKYAQARAQSLQGMFSAEAMNEFKKYYDDAIKNYKPGQLPEPNELEANFVKTGIYKSLQNKYAIKIKDTMNEVRSEAPSKTEAVPAPKAPVAAPKATVGKAPPTSIPAGYTRIGKTREGKAIYRTPDNKQVVEQ